MNTTTQLTSLQIANAIDGMNYDAAIQYCESFGAKRDPMGDNAIARFYYNGADDFYAFMFFKSVDYKPLLTRATRPKFNFNHQIISYID